MKLVIQIIIFILITGIALCGYFFIRSFIVAHEEVVIFSDLQRTYTNKTEASVNELSDFIDESITRGLPQIEIDFDALMLINPDTVGWISIPDTVISYPVVQTSDNLKYLDTSFDGNRSSAGTPFVNSNNDMQILDRNTVIYGHNMGSGRTDMFSSLLIYKDYEYYIANKLIWFDTIYLQYGWWEIFAVIHIDIHNHDFQSQQLIFHNDEYMEWIDQAMILSMYDSDIIILPNSNILTLSTCDRSIYGRNGRLLILAVHI